VISTEHRMNRLGGCSAILAACLVAGGCSNSGDRPDLGEVSGTVTLDGQPLANASIAFCQPGFRPSIGSTDSKGHYELIYIRDIKGATVGTHTVKIKCFGEPGQQVKRVPRKYNDESKLTQQVKPGQNVINFDLKSNS
jgi:hypothetical protein